MPRVELGQDPEELAAAERKRFRIGVEEQLGWKSPYEGFKRWRRAVEGSNTLVFQVPMPVEEVRALSLADGGVAAIAVSSSDWIAARIFSLFHEYAHLLLGSAGMCNPEEGGGDHASLQETERLCNHFAGAFLVPRDALRDAGASIAVLHQVAQRFKVSRQVILRRMQISGLIPYGEYESKIEEWEKDRTQAPEVRRFQGMRAAQRCLHEKGALFASLVLEARNREIITHSDVADYLSLKMKHLGEVESIVSRG